MPRITQLSAQRCRTLHGDMHSYRKRFWKEPNPPRLGSSSAICLQWLPQEAASRREDRGDSEMREDTEKRRGATGTTLCNCLCWWSRGGAQGRRAHDRS